MARLSAFAQQVDVFTGKLNGLARQQLMAEAARLVKAEVLNGNTQALGRAPEIETVVDGRRGAAEETVRPGGQIVYLFAVGAATMENAVDDAYRLFVQLSPVDTGRYRDNHKLLVNGAERDFATEGSVIRFAETDVITLVNVLPYARRIERGWSKQAPNGVYEIIAANLRSRYGRVLNVKFSYGAFLGAEATRDNRYPSIEISVK